ncbi:MAG TPA: ABC transporter substrate-binding protein, partial [Thermoanaerobaculia bacterium]
MRQRLAAVALAGAGTIGVIGAAAAYAASPPAAAPAIGALSAQEETGKRIFTAGIGSGGRAITAVIGGSGGSGDGDPGVEVAASTLACAGCHGRDGKGGGEGGVFPSNLTWESLARPVEAGGERTSRAHPAYTDRLFKRAVTLGLDPAGNKLHVAMPRYQLTQEEAAALLAYVRRLGHEPEPGVTAQALQVGVLLPEASQPPGAAAAIRAVLGAYFDDLNRTGGLYGRRLEARFEEIPAASAERAAKLREILDGEPPLFALAPSFIAGAEAETAAAVAQAQIPLIGALTPEPETAAPLNRYVFYLSSGLADQARALVAATAARLERGRPLALVVDDPASATTARKQATDAALAESVRQGLPEP